MRSILEIIEASKDGHQPSQEEAYWTMLALDLLLSYDHIALENVCQAVKTKTMRDMTAKTALEGSLSRLREAMKTAPDEIVKDSGKDPNDEAYREKRKAFKEKRRQETTAALLKNSVDRKQSQE